MGAFRDLSGEKFGRLTVVCRVGTKNRKVLWRCLCECGNETTLVSGSIVGGHTRSCGCLRAEITSKMKTTHKKQKTSEYNSWKAMIWRCTNPNYRYYHEYGGRGITVCDRWRKFDDFLEDMGQKPSSKHSIDRIDVNGNYEPSNCRWATVYEQARNRRASNRNRSGRSGVYQDAASGKWIANIRNDGKKITIGRYDDINDAINARDDAEKLYWGKSS